MIRRLLLVTLVLGCNDVPGIDRALSRMMHQPVGRTYGPSEVFEDGRAMRTLPDGVVAREQALSPMPQQPISRALLERGRDRFDIHCAVCHGVLGNGDSVVAHNMELRKPPSLHEPRLVALTPEELHRVVAEGYGLMPSYRSHLAPIDRWAVVAYVRALQLSQRIPIVALPANVREEALRSLD